MVTLSLGGEEIVALHLKFFACRCFPKSISCIVWTLCRQTHLPVLGTSEVGQNMSYPLHTVALRPVIWEAVAKELHSLGWFRLFLYSLFHGKLKKTSKPVLFTRVCVLCENSPSTTDSHALCVLSKKRLSKFITNWLSKERNPMTQKL